MVPMQTPDHSAPYCRFSCQHCGWCCQNQLIRVFSPEIHTITSFLREQSRTSLEEHITACLAYEGLLPLYGADFTDRWALLHNFVEPYEYEECTHRVALIKTHVITLLPESKRCVFYNPLVARCFIYEVRPVTCRLFPFTIDRMHLTLVSEGEHCPGVNVGAPIALRHYDALSQRCNDLLDHDQNLFWDYVRQAGYHVQTTQDPISMDAISRRTRFIDPFSAPLTPNTRKRLAITN